jgi:hypothetical protein
MIDSQHTIMILSSCYDVSDLDVSFKFVLVQDSFTALLMG